MILTKRFAFPSIILIIGLLLSGCGVLGQAAAPTMDAVALQATIDASVIRAMQTEAAKMTSTAAALPTTTVAPTATLEPSSTATPKATATIKATLAIPAATKTLTISTPKPTATAVVAAYNCTLISTTPEKSAKININTDFDTVWVVKNTGTKTWEAGYVDLVYLSGTKMQTVADSFDVNTVVKKDGEITLTVDMKAPSATGKYTETFGLVMEGVTMCLLPVKIEAVAP